MKRNVILSILSAAALTASSASFASNEDNLGLAIHEAQAGLGGMVLSLTQGGQDAQHKYDAIVMDPNGIMQHVSFDLPIDYLWPVKTSKHFGISPQA